MGNCYGRSTSNRTSVRISGSGTVTSSIDGHPLMLVMTGDSNRNGLIHASNNYVYIKKNYHCWSFTL